MKQLFIFVLVFLIKNIGIAQIDVRTIDGSNNNLDFPEWGMTGSTLFNKTSIAFEDGISEAGGQNRPSPRLISNDLFGQYFMLSEPKGLSDFCWTFGQFLDHDITFVNDHPSELLEIEIETCDEFFDPMCLGSSNMLIRRSEYDTESGTSLSNHRKFVNSITPFIDASGIYGSDENRATWLRTFNNGKLKTSNEIFLPYNTISGEKEDEVDINAPFMLIEGNAPYRHFVAGDLRANEQPTLAVLHTLFLREHNRLCEKILIQHPDWEDEQIYQTARKWVGAFIQNIAFQEFLPALGIEISDYDGYEPETEAVIFNVFSAAAFRMGHTMVNEHILRLDEQGDIFNFGSINIKDAFFNPFIITEEGGIDPFLRGMVSQAQQSLDTKVINTLRNFLFGQPGAGGFDLVAINLLRGRERGLPDYNTVRMDFDLAPMLDFQEISSNTNYNNALKNIYSSLWSIDPWVGMLAEEHLEGKIVGELLHKILKTQFELLRNADRFWYENDSFFTEADLLEIKNTQLSDIILRNTLISQMPENVFQSVNSDFFSSVEITGLSEFSNISLDVFPNPAIEILNIELHSEKANDYNLSLNQLNGIEIFKTNIQVHEGDNYFQFDLEDMNIPSGAVLIKIENKLEKGSLVIIKR